MKKKPATNNLSQFCENVKKDVRKNGNFKFDEIKRIEVQSPQVNSDSVVYMYGLSSF